MMSCGAYYLTSLVRFETAPKDCMKMVLESCFRPKHGDNHNYLRNFNGCETV